MPFEVFRRHQRKMLAIFAILAMFGFVVSDSLPKLLSSNYGRTGPAGRHALRQDRTSTRATSTRWPSSEAMPIMFVSRAEPVHRPQTPFGDLKTGTWSTP